MVGHLPHGKRPTTFLYALLVVGALVGRDLAHGKKCSWKSGACSSTHAVLVDDLPVSTDASGLGEYHIVAVVLNGCYLTVTGVATLKLADRGAVRDNRLERCLVAGRTYLVGFRG